MRACVPLDFAGQTMADIFSPRIGLIYSSTRMSHIVETRRDMEDTIHRNNVGILSTSAWELRSDCLRSCVIQKATWHCPDLSPRSTAQLLQRSNAEESLPLPDALARCALERVAKLTTRAQRNKAQARLERFKVYPAYARNLLCITVVTNDDELVISTKDRRVLYNTNKWVALQLPDAIHCFVRLVTERPFLHIYLEQFL